MTINVLLLILVPLVLGIDVNVKYYQKDGDYYNEINTIQLYSSRLVIMSVLPNEDVEKVFVTFRPPNGPPCKCFRACLSLLTIFS